MTTEAHLSVSSVLQQVFIAVDEAGTEAAAATAVIVDESSAVVRRRNPWSSTGRSSS